jgi:hypothetical protein
VYAYARIDYQNQYVTYTGDGQTSIFEYNNNIIVNSGDQLVVAIDSIIQTYGVDYSISDIYVVFPAPPTNGQLVTIARRSTGLFFGDGSTDSFSLANIYSVTGVETVTVYINGSIQRPIFDYDLDGSNNLIFVTAPDNDTEIIVRAETYFKYIDTLTVPGIASDARFGQNVSASYSGSQILVGAPLAAVTDADEITYTKAGQAYVFDRSLQSFQVTDPTVTSYTTTVSITEPTFVTLNGVYLTNSAGNFGGTLGPYKIELHKIL